MEFEGRKMDFREADHRCAEFERQHDAGIATGDEEFDAQRKRLMAGTRRNPSKTNSPHRNRSRIARRPATKTGDGTGSVAPVRGPGTGRRRAQSAPRARRGLVNDEQVLH